MEIRNMKTTALAIGSTSVIALIASASQSLAEGLYMGLGLGVEHGDNPSPGEGETEDYQMGGGSVSAFIGLQHDLANDMFTGVELAFSGPKDGDVDNQSSYEYAYTVNYTVDATVRFGKHMGSVDVYGLAGLTTGNVSNCCYGADYGFYGASLGVGAQMDLSEKMFAGFEYIHRFTEGTEDETPFSSSHGTASLRIGYKF